MKMVLARYAVRDDLAVPENDCRIANRSVPTPAALIPSCFLVNPFFHYNAVGDLGALTEWFAYCSNHFRLRHTNRNLVRSAGSGLASVEEEHCQRQR
jgi:hypothetical protein